MPKFEVTAPDGQKFEVNGPEGSTQEQAIEYIQSQWKPRPEEGDFMRGLKSYFPSIKETLGGAQVLAGKALGSEDIMRGGVERVRGAQAEQKGKETDDLTAAWDKGIGTVLTDWLPYQIGSGVGNVAESVAMAGVGSLFGGAIGGAGGIFAKQLVKKGIKEAAKDVIEEQIAKGATKEAAREAGEKFVAEMGAKELEENAAKFLAKQGGKAYGLTAGLGAQALTHGMGETTSRALQEAEMDPTKLDLGTLLPAAGVHSIADYISERVMLGGLKGMDLGGLTQKSTGKMLYDVLKGVSLTGLKEIPPETLQSAAERYGAKLPLSSAEAMSEYINTAGAAFAMSILPGGIGGVQTRMRGTPEERKAAYEQAAKDLGQLDTSIPASESGEIRAMEQQGEIGLGIQPPDFAPEEKPEEKTPITLGKDISLDDFSNLSREGRIQQARTNDQELADLTSGNKDFAELSGLNYDLPETYDVIDDLNNQGYKTEYNDKTKTTFVYKDRAAIEPVLAAESPYEYGKAYGYSEADIAKFYIQRRGGDVQSGYEDFLNDVGGKPVSKTSEDVHPLETTGKESVKAEQAAEAAGIYLRYTRDQKIDVQKSTTDWNVIKGFKTVGQYLRHIQDFVPLDQKEIIKRVMQSADNIPLILNRKFGPDTKGVYRHQTDEKTGKVYSQRIELNPRSNGNDFQTIVHEATHAATISNYIKGLNGDKRYAQAAKDLDNLVDYLAKYHKDRVEFFGSYPKKKWGREMITWSLTDRKLQNFLKTVEMPNKKTAWSQFVTTMRKLLGLPESQETALSQMLDISDRLLGTQEQVVSPGSAKTEVETEQAKQAWHERETPDAWGRDDALRGMYNRMQSVYDESYSPEEAYQAAYDSASTAEKYILRELKKDDFLGFDYPHQAIQAIVEDAGAYDLSRGLKTAISRLGNKVFAQPKAPEIEQSVSRHKNYEGKDVPDATWGLRPYADMSARSRIMDDIIYKYLDKHKDLKDIINAIKAANRKVTATWDAYMKETLYHNRVAYLSKMFVNNELKPLAEAMVKAGVTEPELNNFLLARHAETYNNEINLRNDNPAVKNRGSGVHTLVARAYMGLLTPQQVQAIANSKDLNENEKKLMADLKSMTPEKRAKLADLAKRVDSIIARTQDMTVAGGIEKQSTIDYWRDKYPNYVPLKRDPDELDFVASNLGMGAGFSTRAGFGKAAVGSLKGIDNILSNIVLQRDMSIMRAEKARIGRALYGLFLQNPNPGFVLPVNPNVAVVSKANELYAKIQMDERKLEAMQKRIEDNQINGIEDVQLMQDAQALSDRIVDDKQRHLSLQKQAETAQQILIKELEDNGIDPKAAANLIKEPEGAFYNPKTGKVEYRTNAYLRSMSNVLAIPIDGETRYLFFNPADERAMRMVKSLKNLDVEKLGEITSTIAKFTRWIAMVNTQYNPFFGILNMMRDVQGAQFNLTTTALRGQQMAVNSHIMPSLFAIYNSLRGERAGKQYQDGVTGGNVFSYADKWNEFQKFGGPTGFKDMLARDRDQISVLQEEIARLQENPGKKMGRRAFDAIVGRLADFNDSMENAVRLSAFIEAQKKFQSEGMTYEQASEKAAELAKNLTVNFNRKGQKSQLVNSWYAFFNASAQGAARLIETVRGPAGKKIMSALILMGVMQSLLLKAADFDDDDPPPFVREKNFVIPTGGGKYLSLPLPLGFNLFVNFGRISSDSVADVLFNGGRNMPKNIANMASVVSNTFNPFGSSGLSIQTLAPTIADPLAALAENKDAFGRPIYREDRATNPTPGYLRSRDGTFGISKFLAEAMNRMSGGTEFQKGYISPTADEIEYLAGQLGGGVWREGRKLMGFAGDVATGEETAPYKIPLAGRFYGDTSSNANISNRFYENVTELAKYEQEIKGRAKTGQEYQSFMESHPESYLFQSANRVENTISKLNKTRRALIESGASKDQVKQIDDYKIQIMKQFNDAVASAIKS